MNQLYQDLELPTYPSRCRLNNIEPVGIDGSLTESLTSYVTRLAGSHCLPVGVLMETEIAPVINKAHGGANLHKIYSHTSALNGTGTMALNLARSLEELTGQRGLDLLTFRNWSELVPQRKLLHQYRTWCPICYQEWQILGQVVYEPLFWALAIIKACPVHQCLMSETCPHCHQKNLYLAWHTRSGYCSKCQKWLGSPLNGSSEDPRSLSKDDLRALVLISESVAKLLAYTSRLTVPLTKKDLTQAFRKYINVISGGNIAEFARQLQLPKNTVWLWCNGKNLPQLDTLAQVCYHLNCSLVEFITQEPEQNIYVATNKAPMLLQSKPKAEAKALNMNQLEQRLESFFLNHECPPPSMEEVARRLNVHRETIFRFFPDLCRAVSAKYDQFQKFRYRHAIEQSCNEVKQAVLKLYSEGLYPSEGRVSQLISKPGYLRYKQVRAAIEEAKLEFNSEVANSSND
jgi:transcriptional regulator with XRE-family HTH domain